MKILILLFLLLFILCIVFKYIAFTAIKAFWKEEGVDD